MDKLMKAASMCTNKIKLPSKEILDAISIKSSYGRSMNKLKITDDLVNCVMADVISYECLVQNSDVLKDYAFRVKAEDSIMRKIERYPDKDAKQIFNDVLSLRLIVDEYPETYPDYFRVVDMSEGKADNDGYRGVHLYYKRDNYSYTIEIQLWSKEHQEFNTWMHRKGYKTVDDILNNRFKKEDKEEKNNFFFVYNRLDEN